MGKRDYIDEKHYNWIKQQSCCISKSYPSDSHHVIHRSTGVTLDCLLVPISREFHEIIHHRGGYTKLPLTREALLYKAIEYWNLSPFKVFEIDLDSIDFNLFRLKKQYIIQRTKYENTGSGMPQL